MALIYNYILGYDTTDNTWFHNVEAESDFMDNKIPVFGGTYLNDFEDKFPFAKYDFIFHVNNLISQKEIVEWYLGFNTGGSIHTEDDLKPAYEYLKTL